MLEDELVLDLGGGTSWKDLIGIWPEEKIRCVEFNAEMLDHVPFKHLVYRNIDKHGLPFHDNSCQYVRARDILEHFRDLQFVVNEVWRVLRHDGIFDIKCPSSTSLGAWGNPDHVRIINTYTIEHLANPIPNANIFSKFEILENKDDSNNIIAKLKAVKEGVVMTMKGSPIEDIGIRW